MKRLRSFANVLRDLCDRAAKFPRLMLRRPPAQNLVVGQPLPVQTAQCQDLGLDLGETSPLGRDLRLRKIENQAERDAQQAFALPYAPILANRNCPAPAPVGDDREMGATDLVKPVDLNATSATLPPSSLASSGDSVLPPLSPAFSVSFALSETGASYPATIVATPLTDITMTTRAQQNRMPLGIVGGRYVNMLSIV